MGKSDLSGRKNMAPRSFRAGAAPPAIAAGDGGGIPANINKARKKY